MSSRADPQRALRAARDEPQSRRHATRNALRGAYRQERSSASRWRCDDHIVRSACCEPAKPCLKLAERRNVDFSADLPAGGPPGPGQSPSSSHCTLVRRLVADGVASIFAPDQTVQPVSRLLVWSRVARAPAPRLVRASSRRFHPEPPPLPRIARHFDHARRMRGVSAPLDARAGTPRTRQHPEQGLRLVFTAPPAWHCRRVRERLFDRGNRVSDAGRVRRKPYTPHAPVPRAHRQSEPARAGCVPSMPRPDFRLRQISPITEETKVVRVGDVDSPASALPSSRAGSSICGLCEATSTLTSWLNTPEALNRSTSVATASLSPEMMQVRGLLIAAIETLRLLPGKCSGHLGRGRSTSAIAPRPLFSRISALRRHTILQCVFE